MISHQPHQQILTLLYCLPEKRDLFQNYDKPTVLLNLTLQIRVMAQIGVTNNTQEGNNVYAY